MAVAVAVVPAVAGVRVTGGAVVVGVLVALPGAAVPLLREVPLREVPLREVPLREVLLREVLAAHGPGPERALARAARAPRRAGAALSALLEGPGQEGPAVLLRREGDACGHRPGHDHGGLRQPVQAQREQQGGARRGDMGVHAGGEHDHQHPPAHQRRPQPQSAHRQPRPQRAVAGLQPGHRPEGQADGDRSGRADGQADDVGRLEVLLSGAVQVGEPDDGEDHRQQHHPLAAQRLPLHLLEDDESDDADDGEDFQTGHDPLPWLCASADRAPAASTGNPDATDGAGTTASVPGPSGGLRCRVESGPGLVPRGTRPGPSAHAPGQPGDRSRRGRTRRE